MQLNAHRPMAISMRRKNNGNLVQTLAIEEKELGEGDKGMHSKQLERQV
jgi:hypothetical protein